MPVSLFVLLVTLLILTYQVILLDKFYPLTYLGSINISLLTKEQAASKFDYIFNERKQEKKEFIFEGQFFTIDIASTSAKITYQGLFEEFDRIYRESLKQKLLRQLTQLFNPKEINPNIAVSLDSQIEEIAKVLDKEPQNARLIFDEASNEASPSARIQIIEAKFGLRLNKDLLQKEVLNYLTYGDYQIDLPLEGVPPKITTDHVIRAKEALETLQKESIKLKFEGNVWVLDVKQLLALLDLTSGSELLLDKDKSLAYISKIAKEIDQDVQEGLFEFNPDTKRVSAFQPSQEGRKLDTDKTYNAVTDVLITRSSKTINLPVAILKPKIQTADVNNLGIKELLGRGTSHFTGSIQNRIYNIDLAASRINGILIPPGETFSFNEKVGDISAASGYKSAYVIKSGRTVLDDGGGVCQDSTTLFRAVLNAGLSVVQRVAHAYRVGYYEQGFPPGLDATVWAPAVDFKFKNDTPAHILIQAYTSGATLYVDLYGTSDGRVSAISRSKVSDQTPPPPELRQDDPTLPKGTVKQVDFPAWGANVTFTRTVTRGGEVIIKETWNSSYKSWQAVYLVGTKEN